MGTRYVAIVVAAACCLACCPLYAQQPTLTDDTSTKVAIVKINPGTLLQVEITSDLDAKKAHEGDIFRTRLWADLRSGDSVLLPEKTILVGHVVEAQPRSKANPESKLTIAFDKALMKDGSELPLNAVVERVQLSPMAAAAAAETKSASYNQGLNPGSTTNIAMPSQAPSSADSEGDSSRKKLAPGPTNVRDTSITTQADASGTQTVLTSTNKSDLKLKHYVTLDLRITKVGE